METPGETDPGQLLCFSTWYLALSDYKDTPAFDPAELAKKLAGPEAALLCSAYDTIGVPFPSYDNFGDTLKLCDQFLEGRIDPDLLIQVGARAVEDLDAVAPFAEAFRKLDQGESYGMPMVIVTFGYPLSLFGMIARNTDEDGLVTGMSPDDRAMLKSLIEQGVSGLQRRGSAPEPS